MKKRLLIILSILGMTLMAVSPAFAADMQYKRSSFKYPSLPFGIATEGGDYRKLVLTGTFVSNERLEISIFLKNVERTYMTHRCDVDTSLIVNRIGIGNTWQGDGISFTVTSAGNIENLLYAYDHSPYVSDLNKCRLRIDHLVASIPMPHLNLLLNQEDEYTINN